MQAHLLVGQQTDKLFTVDSRRCRHGACFGYNGHDRMRHGIVDYFRCRTRAGWTEMNALVGDGSKHVVASSKRSDIAPNQQHGRSSGHLADTRHDRRRSEEHTSELQSLMRISYAVFCLKKKKTKSQQTNTET